MNREKFISVAATASALSLLDSHFIWGNHVQISVKTHVPLIQSIELLTTTPLSSMREFYNKLIGFQLIGDTKSQVRFKTGQSTLSFVASDNQSQRPFYHFAFNIPENKIVQAYHWQKAKTRIVLPRPGMQKNDDSNYPSDVVHFRNWNAHSVFFLDPAGNLVEYIARHSLKNSTPGDFSVEDVLCISEIGLITEDVNDLASLLKNNLSLSDYGNGSDSFRPIGDENGLLLAIKNGIIWTGHEGQENKTDSFKTIIDTTRQIPKPLILSPYPYEIN